MNIWIINENTGSRIHGMVFRPYYLAKEFVKQGNEVTIFSGSFSHVYSNPPEVTGFSKNEEIDGISYCWIKTPKYGKSQSLGRIINAFVYVIKLFFLNKKQFGKPDVIIVTSPTPFSIINGYCFKKRFKARLIFEVRDIWPLTLIDIGSISKKHPFVVFTQFFENFSYKVADRVVSVLPNSKGHMMAHGLKETDFVYIPNGVDVGEANDYHEISDKIRQMVPEDKFIVMYAGKFGVSNNLKVLLKSAEIMKDNSSVFFILVGAGPEKETIIKMIEEKGLNNIKVSDPVLKSEIQSILKLADICYIGLTKSPLFHLGVSPNKIYDYMLAGKPIIFSVETSENIISKSGCGISVEAENPEKIAEAANNLLKMSKEEREAIGKKGYDYVLENHTYEKLAREYLDVFNDLMETEN